jgi:hypothetical protein
LGAIGLGSISEFGFTLNLGDGVISDGNLRITYDSNAGQVWNIDFSGQAKSASGGFGPFATFTIGTTTIEGYSGSYEFAGNMTGMFINEGQQIVTAFAFDNVASTGDNQHVAGNLVASGVGVEAVSWGDWNNPVGQAWTGSLGTAALAYFADYPITPLQILQNLQGQFTYSIANQAADFSAESSHGSVEAVNANFDIDFDTGVISNGNLRVDVVDPNAIDDHIWQVDFAGSVSNGAVSLDIDFATSTVQHESPMGTTDLHNSSSLGGVFSGSNAGVFVGGFDLKDNVNPANTTQGLFTLQQGSLISGD